MAVNLSPIGGVAGQFFDNNGNPLTGGKIYTYVAGTTTPQATYTSAAGSTAHTNPIILDAGGRVPGGEIWLTDGLQYKFVLKTSTDVLIGTYDNIVGINSNFVNFTNQQEIQTATAGQTVFTLATVTYSPGTNSLSVFVDGVNQYGPGATYAYLETDSTTITFLTGLHVGASVKFTTSQLNSGASAVTADAISYTPAGTGAVPTTVQAKLRESVSVLDFGADSTGSVNATTAFTNALATGRNVYAPAGTYKLNALPLLSNQAIFGDGMRRTIFIPAAGATSVLLVDATGAQTKQNVTLQDICIRNPNNVTSCYGIWFKSTDVYDINDQHNLTNVEIGPVGWGGTSYKFAKGIYATGRLISLTAINTFVSGNTVNWHSATDPSTPAFNGHVFINCVFEYGEQQGFLHTGQSTNVLFNGGYTQSNNTLSVAGVAGMDFSNAINLEISNHGFEANGSGVVVNTGAPLTNSISFIARGTTVTGLFIRDCYFTSSGSNIVIDSTVTNLIGGKIENNYLNCLSGGFNFATLGQGGSNTALNPLKFSSTNSCNGKISIYTAGIGINAVAEQNNGIGYLTATATDIDLLKTAAFNCNPGAPFTISTVANMIPGCELTILNTYGSSTVTIAAALMRLGANSDVLTGTVGRFIVQGSPDAGKFVRIQ